MERKVPDLALNSILKLPTVRKGYIFTDRREVDKVHVRVTPMSGFDGSMESPMIRVNMNDTVMSAKQSKRFLMS